MTRPGPACGASPPASIHERNTHWNRKERHHVWMGTGRSAHPPPRWPGAGPSYRRTSTGPIHGGGSPTAPASVPVGLPRRWRLASMLERCAASRHVYRGWGRGGAFYTTATHTQPRPQRAASMPQIRGGIHAPQTDFVRRRADRTQDHRRSRVGDPASAPPGVLFFRSKERKEQRRREKKKERKDRQRGGRGGGGGRGGDGGPAPPAGGGGAGGGGGGRGGGGRGPGGAPPAG